MVRWKASWVLRLVGTEYHYDVRKSTVKKNGTCKGCEHAFEDCANFLESQETTKLGRLFARLGAGQTAEPAAVEDGANGILHGTRPLAVVS